MIRVGIKAASPVARAGLETLLRSYPLFQVVEDDPDPARTSGASFDDLHPDVLVVLLESHNDGDARQLREEIADGVPMVALVPGPAAEWSAAFRQGVPAVLSNRATGEQIAAAIEAVAAGLGVFPADEAENLFDAALPESREILLETLTPREIEVLHFMAEGLANKEIAARLGISEHTAKFHVASVMGKLGAGNRTEAVMAGIRHGIVLI